MALVHTFLAIAFTLNITQKYPFKEVHSNGFEGEMESMVEKVKSFIQKEFKKVTKSALSLSDPSEVDVLVEYISRIRCSVKVHKCYKIGGTESEGQA